MKKLYLGVSREIITPPVGSHLYGYSPDIISESVNDDLELVSFFFDDGQTNALLCSITVCEMNTEFCDSLRRMLSKELCIPKENIMLCATHTHSGPNVAGSVGWGDIDKEYCNGILIPRLLSGAKKAKQNRICVKMGVAAGESLVGINRRQSASDVSAILGQNENGCINKRMTVISFVDENDKPYANIVHYGCHGTCAGPNKEITRDWAGIMTDALATESGAVTAFVNGTMGDIGPRISNGKTTGDLSYVRELGEVAKRDARVIYNKIDAFETPSLEAFSKIVKIPLKPRMDNETASEMYKLYKDQSVNLGGMIRAYLESVIELNNKGEKQAEFFEIEQNVIALGDIVLTGIPYEMFSETGLLIDESVKNRDVLCVSNTNGFMGYFATQNELCRGGYEVEMFLFGRPQPFCENADSYLVDLMSRNIRSIDKGEE